jgi:DNA-binding GntR family transcriptional regulator
VPAPDPSDDSRSATVRAYQWTRHAVLTGLIDSGALISEGEVAEAVRVSRTPVREAFLQLQAEGMLRLYPKRGALVVPVTAAEVRDVMEARRLIEPWAFARAAWVSITSRTSAAGQGDPAGLAAELEASIETQAAHLAAGDDAGFQEADRAFHTAVVVAAGNRLVADFYRSLRDRQLRIGALATTADTARATRILAEHRDLAAAVAIGDAARATEIVTAHVRATGAALGAVDGSDAVR